MPNPWDMNWGAPQASGGGLEAVPLPDRTPKTSYRTLSPQEAAANGLPAGGVYQISSEGNISTAASPKSADSATFKPTEFQSKSAGFLGRMVRADRAWAPIADDEKGPRGVVRQWFHESHPDLENTLLNSDARQTADQNVNDFIAASLRQESGAAISPVEFDRQYRIFFPMPGDGPDVLKQKAAARAQAIQGFSVAAGPLGEEVLAKMGSEQQPAVSSGASPSTPEEPPGLNLDQKGNVILEDRGRGTIQGSDTGFLGLKGGEHTENIPERAGMNAQINALLKKGASDTMFIAFMRGKGVDPDSIRDILGQVRDVRAFRKQNPGFKGDFNVDVERRQIPNSAWENFNNSDVGVGLDAGLDAATGFNMDSLQGLVGGDAEEARQARSAAQAAHSKSALAGTIAGGVTGALGLEGGLAATGAPGLARVAPDVVPEGIAAFAPIIRATLADMGYGAAAGAGATDYAEDGSPATAADRAVGAAKGAAAATAGGLAGQAVAGVGRSVARGAKDPYVAAINAEGVPTTVGQQYTGKLGGIVKRTEDRIAGLPIIGDIINARRVEGITKWNEKVFDRTLEPIGVKIEGRVGETAVDYAQRKISDAFNKALKGKAVVADKPFATELTNAVTGVASLPRVGGEVADGVRVILEPYMRGTTIPGEAMQQISRELRDLKASYVKDPLKKRIGDSIDKVEDAVFGPFQRQAPDILPEYNKAKLAQRRLYTVADAVNAAKNKEGVFMPSQLGSADRAATKRTEGKVAAARGRGQFHDMQRSAQEVLPGKIPDSGTAGRIIIPGIALGVGGGSDASGLTNGAGTTLAGILALAYTRAGQRILTKPGRGMSGRTGKVLQSDRTRNLLTAGGAATGAGLATQQ